MRIQLERITSRDARATRDLEPGEIVEHDVEVSVDGRRRTFTVFLKASVLPGLDAGLIYGDELLEELLRFEPAGLSALYAAVGRYRRGASVDLPLMLLDSSDEAASSARLSG